MNNLPIFIELHQNKKPIYINIFEISVFKDNIVHLNRGTHFEYEVDESAKYIKSTLEKINNL